ncbi:MAG TPA: hypothetical protein VM925_09005 [Labilithrix sp.]|jgi:hypothetical protein|nr:hypothetical protein [Labilithrix sp.]
MQCDKERQDVTLIDVLIDGFEKNEIMRGFHWRSLPMPDEGTARAKFDALVDEARRWKGPPTRENLRSERRIAAWSDIEIRQVGRGIMVLVRAPGFDAWWHDKSTWKDDPMGALYKWVKEDRAL